MEYLIYAWNFFYCINAVISSDIISFEVNTTSVKEGSAVLFKCLSQKQTYGIEFLRDSSYLGLYSILNCLVISTDYITSKNTSSDSYNENYLTIKRFIQTMAGLYTCRSIETGDSKMINLTIAAPITYVNLNPTNNPVSVIENTSYQFECETSIGSPYATVRWFKDNRTIDNIADDIELTPLSTSSQLNEVTRSVLQFQPTKHDHGMRLFCLANNGDGPSTPTCQFNSSMVNESIYIREGQDLTILCSADGNPPPFLTWTYPGGTYSGPTLRLSKIATDTIPIDAVFISSPTKDVVVLQDNEELIVKCECLDGIPKATFEWFLDNATNDNKTDDKLIANDIDVSVENQFQNGITVSFFTYKAKPSESGTRIYCLARNVVNEVRSSNSLLLAIIGIPGPPYNIQVKDVTHDAATLKWNQLYTGGLELSVAMELQGNTNEWEKHEVSEFVNNNTNMRASLNNLKASTSYVLRVTVYNVLGRSNTSDEMNFQTLEQNGGVSSFGSAALLGGISGAFVLGVALGFGAACLIVKVRRGRASKQVFETTTAEAKRGEKDSTYSELDVPTMGTSTSYEMITHNM
ncbi:HMCN2-like protein [Mya arenaria]|uniref:HMCN2-like protein n=1 Tax=Mya arenaria TaxID=6604 RepID=A0ABY7DEC0_MYAAR|nr:HMCN2-like protein [Mya arenaria]